MLRKNRKNLLKTLFSVTVVSAVIVYSHAAQSTDIEEISQRLRQGDYSVVKSELIPLAESGNARAQFNLGVSYAMGNGVEKNLAKAHEWTLKAAKGGDIRAQVNVASIYFDGRGVKRDIPEALKWYETAATAGDINANLALGRMYRDGIPGKVDYAKAFKYFSVAAEEGDNEAKYNLAGFYKYGLGVKRDEVKSKQLFASLPGPAQNMAATFSSFSTAAGGDNDSN